MAAPKHNSWERDTTLLLQSCQERSCLARHAVMFHVCRVFCFFIFFFKREEQKKKKKTPERASREKSPRKMWHRCAWVTERTFENIHLQERKEGNSEPPAAAVALTDEIGKIGHAHPKCALPLWETVSDWRITPSVFPALWAASFAAAYSKRGSPVCSLFNL